MEELKAEVPRAGINHLELVEIACWWTALLILSFDVVGFVVAEVDEAVA